MIGQYGTIYNRLVRDAGDLRIRIEAMRKAGETVPAWRIQQMERYQSMIRQLEAELVRYGEDSAKLISTLQRDAAGLGYEMAHEQLALLRPAGVSITFTRMPITAIESMAGFLADGSPLSLLLQREGAATARAVGEALTTGFGMGWNPRRTARLIRQRAGMALTRALRIARTEQIRAWHQSTLQGYRDNGAVLRGYQRIAAHDSRTCLACLMKDGEFYAVEEDFTDHVNGRCALVPITKPWADLGFEDIEETSVKWQSGEAWFREQSADAQRDIMGNKIYAAWKGGQISLQDVPHLQRSPVWGDAWTQGSLTQALENAERRRALL